MVWILLAISLAALLFMDARAIWAVSRLITRSYRKLLRQKTKDGTS